MYEPIEENKKIHNQMYMHSSNNTCACIYLFLVVFLAAGIYVLVGFAGDFSVQLGSSGVVENKTNLRIK